MVVAVCHLSVCRLLHKTDQLERSERPRSLATSGADETRRRYFCNGRRRHDGQVTSDGASRRCGASVNGWHIDLRRLRDCSGAGQCMHTL